MYKRLIPSSAVLVAAVLLIGCGGPPSATPLLIEARAAYQEAARDPAIIAQAAVMLQEAEEELLRAESALRKDAEVADHYAYLAKQRVLIAEETVRLRQAEAQVASAEGERQEVQLRAREQEATAAERRAEQSRREAEAAQQEAEAAQQEAAETGARAEELARRIEELEAEATERGLVLTLSDVLFDVGRADLKPGALRTVERLVDFLSEYPERTVVIEGHTDITGTRQTNMTLSQRRAESVRLALIERGVPGTRINAVGYGPDHPVASNETTAGRQQNRRVEVIISDRTGRVGGRQ